VKNWTMCLTSLSPFLKKLRHEALPWTFLQSSFALSSGRRGKNTSVLDKEECSTNVETKLLMVCSFCGDLPWVPCAMRHLAWEGLNTRSVPSSREHPPVGQSTGLISGHTLHRIPAHPSETAGPAVALDFFSPPSPAPLPTLPVYTDDMLARAGGLDLFQIR
jgi:hypothetical protein